jgi:hypothetical protein
MPSVSSLITGPSAAAVFLLVFLHGMTALIPRVRRVGAIGRRRVRLIAQRGAGPGAGRPLPRRLMDGLQQRDEPRAVAVLAGAEDPADRAAAPVRGQVDLGAQPAAGSAQGLPARPAGFLSFAAAP